MTYPAPPTAPLTAQAVQALVKEMMVQKSQLLNIAEENALKALREEPRKNQPRLLDTINFEVEAAREYDTHDWKNPVNKDNFHTMNQVHQLWKRTEQFVGSLDVLPEQVQLKAASIKDIEEDKSIAHNCMKCTTRAGKPCFIFTGTTMPILRWRQKRRGKQRKGGEKETREGHAGEKKPLFR